MNYQKIETCNIGNGTGFRVVLWVSGCNHHCPHCQNQETWNPDSGKPFTAKQEKQIIKYLSKDYISGLTLSGGDPLHPNNIETVTQLCKTIKEKLPNKNIWLYTGSSYEDIENLEITNYVDTIVDGQFKIDLRDITLAFRGSSNQRIIDVKASKSKNSVVLNDLSSKR